MVIQKMKKKKRFRVILILAIFLSMLLIFSKDSAATEKSLRETQKLLKSYFREKDKCKIDWIMRKNLFMLRHSKVEKILKQKRGEDTAEVQIQYFE